MRFSVQSDLAIRLFLYLGSQDASRHVPLHEFCEALDTARPTLSVLVPRLVNAGLIQSKSGPAGGLKLVRTLDDILVSEVITIAEHRAEWKFARCDYDHGCNCYMKGYCAVKPMYQFVANKMIQIFDEFKLSDLQRPINRQNAKRFAEEYKKGQCD